MNCNFSVWLFPYLLTPLPLSCQSPGTALCLWILILLKCWDFLIGSVRWLLWLLYALCVLSNLSLSAFPWLSAIIFGDCKWRSLHWFNFTEEIWGSFAVSLWNACVALPGLVSVAFSLWIVGFAWFGVFCWFVWRDGRSFWGVEFLDIVWGPESSWVLDEWKVGHQLCYRVYYTDTWLISLSLYQLHIKISISYIAHINNKFQISSLNFSIKLINIKL